MDASGKKAIYIYIYIYIHIYIYIFFFLKLKQYENNITENMFVVIMYLKEAFKRRLLLIVESFESPKRRNSNDWTNF